MRSLRHRRSDAVGVLWIALLALLLLSPALKDGHNFGPSDEGSTLSTLTQGSVAIAPCTQPVGAPLAGCQHDRDNGDIIDQAVPWNETDWQSVRRGHFPLWNDQAGTGEPQFLNFESSVLALPTLVGYLVPLSWSFLVEVLVKLLIAGLGAYWCCRVLGARAAAAALGGSSFMFSGALAGWLGWSISGPLVFAGPILASAVLTYRHRGRVLPPFLLACSIAFAVFGGFPEGYALLALAFGVLVVVTAVAVVAVGLKVSRPAVVRLAAGAVGGLGISAVLWLPGISVLRASVRGGEVGAKGLPFHFASLIFAPGYDGLPTAGSVFFGSLHDEALYFETAASVALVTIVLGLVALVSSRRRPIVLGLGAMGAAVLLLSYQLGPVSPVQRLMIDLGLGSVVLSRSLALFGFAISILGALGAEVLVARHSERSVRRTFDGAVLLVGAVVGALGINAVRAGMPAAFEQLRRQSMVWPVATTLFLVALAGTFELLDRRAGLSRGVLGSWIVRIVPLALVGVSSAPGLFAEVGINSYAHIAYPRTPATVQLTSIVKGALLGIDGGNPTISAHSPLGVRQWEGIGFYPNTNVAYGVDELGLHDPLVSADYFASWPVPDSDPGGALNLFVPDVDTVALAQKYGVGYVLSFPNFRAPNGMTAVATINGSVLSKVPDSGKFTMAGSAPLHATHPNDATYVVDTSGRRGRLVARITNSPGWRASSAGRSLPITPVGGVTPKTGVFLSVDVPPGANSVTFAYAPPHLDVSLALFLITVVAFAVAGARSHRLRRVVPPEAVE